MTDQVLERQTPPEETPGGRRHPGVRMAVRLGVGGAVIAILLARSDLGSIADAIRHARAGFLLAALAMMLVFVALGAVRWHVFLRSLSLDLPTPTVLRMYFVGNFFNAFLPTGVGGDAYKAMRLGRAPGTLAPAFASVFLDRFAGIVGLALIGLLGAGIRMGQGDTTRAVVAGAVIAAAILIAAAALVVAGPRLLSETGPEGRWGIRRRLRRTAQFVLQGARDPDSARWGVVAGVAAQSVALATHVLLASGLRLDVSVAALAGVMVLAQVATLIPVTVNGLGFREGAYVWALAPYGVAHAPALAFALLMLALLLAASAVGGLVYVVAGGEPASRSRGGRGTP